MKALPSELQSDALTAVIDTREQLPFDLAPMRSIVATLTTGDYTIAGLEHCIALERKSLTDLLGVIGGGRERFEREIDRLLAYETRAVIVECGWDDLEYGQWDSKVTPAAAVGSCLGWIARGVPFIFAGDRERAQKLAARILYIAARRRYREARQFAEGISEVMSEGERLKCRDR